MKQFKFSMIAFAFIVAIAASAFTLPLEKNSLKAVSGERWFAFTGSDESMASHYADLGLTYAPSEEGCELGGDLCVIKVESTGDNSPGNPIRPEASALNALQQAIEDAKTAEQNDGDNNVYVKGE